MLTAIGVAHRFLNIQTLSPLSCPHIGHPVACVGPEDEIVINMRFVSQTLYLSWYGKNRGREKIVNGGLLVSESHLLSLYGCDGAPMVKIATFTPYLFTHFEVYLVLFHFFLHRLIRAISGQRSAVSLPINVYNELECSKMPKVFE